MVVFNKKALEELKKCKQNMSHRSPLVQLMNVQPKSKTVLSPSYLSSPKHNACANAGVSNLFS